MLLEGFFDTKKGLDNLQPLCIFAMSYQLKAIIMLSFSCTRETFSSSKHDCCRSGIGEVVLGNKEREENGNCSLVDIRCRVGKGQETHRPIFHIPYPLILNPVFTPAYRLFKLDNVSTCCQGEFALSQIIKTGADEKTEVERLRV